MSHRVLQTARTAYRIGDPDGRFPIWDDGGARLFSGRWHLAGDPVIYASAGYSTAMLEKLAHHSGDIPANQHFIQITIPANTTSEVFAPHQAPDWHSPESPGAGAFGHQWVLARRSAILFVPSILAPKKMNILFDTAHPEFAGVTIGLETPVYWDARQFDR